MALPKNSGAYIDPFTLPKVLTKAGDLESIEKTAKNPRESTVLVLYTGGTIGMKVHEGVYKPAENYLVGKLRSISHLHDTEYASKFDVDDDMDRPLVLPCSEHVSENPQIRIEGDSMASGDKKRIIYIVYEYQPLLDSSNMTMDDYVRIAKDIQQSYELFDGFVVLHGTDTMSYTASALSFMLENLGKPVVITGSQIPVSETRTDGMDNFLGALLLAGWYNIPEVSLLFHHKLFRGNRSTKIDTSGLDAFSSPNMLPLAHLAISIHIDWNSVYRPRTLEKFTVFTQMNRNVALLRLFPSITAAVVKAFCQEPIQGIVLQTYGAGNAPDNRSDVIGVLREACDRGVLIVTITQCSRGAVDPLYHTGKVLLDAGVVPGSDMTPEAALTKLSYVLGKDISLEDKKDMMKSNIRGEMTKKTADQINLRDIDLIDAVANTMQFSTSTEITALKDALFPSLMCSAARVGDVQLLRKLKKAGGIFENADYDSRTPLHIACSDGHYDVVKFFLDEGVNLHAKDRFGNPPLHDAIKFGHYHIIDLLTTTGAYITLMPVELGMELCKAASEDDVKLLRAWHQAKADLNTTDYNQRSPLLVAVRHHSVNALKFLLSNRVQVLLPDVYGTTPLAEANKLGSRDVIELLEAFDKDSHSSSDEIHWR